MNQARKTVSLTITQDCNLACTYCYEGYKSKKKMSIDTGIKIIERFLNSSNNDYAEVEIDLFGGEPFLNFPLIKELCEYVWSRSWEKPYLFFATTNGTLVHGEIQEWVFKNKNRFFLGLSLDGTPGMHDINRSKSFSKIDVSFFQTTWPNPSVKMTISKESLPSLAEGVIYLHSLGFLIHSNFAYGIDWADTTNIQVLSRELNKLINFYLDNPGVEPCSLLDMKIQYQGYTEKKYCGVGVEMDVFDVDGIKYPCHGFLPISVGSEKSKASLAIDFSVIENLIDPKCKGCMLYNICPTCYGSNYSESGDPAIRNQQICNLTKVRALACSYFEAKKIFASPPLSADNQENKRLIESIIKIQDQITML